MNQIEEKAFENVVKDALSKQHQRGVKEGAYAICKVILEHATETHKTADKRIEEVINFCNALVEKKERAEKEEKEGDAN